MGNRDMPHNHLNGNQFRKGLRPANAFTSKQVSGSSNFNWVNSITLTCVNCGKTFEQKPWLIHQNKSKTGLKFCNHKCQYAFMRGEQSPLWVGGPQTYRGRSWRKARLLAVKRDKGVCQHCGKVVGDSIPVHHIQPYREFETPEAANTLDNLVCLCQSCHMKREPR